MDLARTKVHTDGCGYQLWDIQPCHWVLGPRRLEKTWWSYLLCLEQKSGHYAVSKCQEPLTYWCITTTIIIIIIIPEKRIWSAATVRAAEDTQRSNITPLISVSSYYCGIRLEALSKIRNGWENCSLIRVSNPVFFKTGHRRCHRVYVQGIAICSAVACCCVRQ